MGVDVIRDPCLAGKIANSISTTGGYMCLAYSLDGKYIALTTTV
jgi:hypothetical protein